MIELFVRLFTWFVWLFIVLPLACIAIPPFGMLVWLIGNSLGIPFFQVG